MRLDDGWLDESWWEWVEDPIRFNPMEERTCCRRARRRCGGVVPYAPEWMPAETVALARTGWLEAGDGRQ